MKYGLPPIINEHSRILILGSLPGEASLRAKQYYAHHKNNFWAIIAAILAEPLPDSYTERTTMLLSHHIALWDVIRFAERQGSLDSNIKNAVPNDLKQLFADYPNIKKVILNGNEAEKQYLRHFKHLDIPIIKVRSSSPVPARTCNTLADKIQDWQRAFV